MHLPQLRIGEVIPPASSSACAMAQRVRSLRRRISIQQRGRFDKLSPVPTPLALVCIVGITQRFRIELEQLSQVVLCEVACCIFGFVHYASR